MKFAVLFAILLSFCASTYSQNPVSHWAQFEKNKIRYYDIGKKSKTALVFVHCWTCNVEFWNESYNSFPEYRVIAMDLIGHGQSDKPKVSYSMDFFAKSV